MRSLVKTDYDDLITSLFLSERTFNIFVAVCDDLDFRDELIQQSEKELTAEGINTYVIETTSAVGSPWYAIRERLDRESFSRPAVVHLLGMERVQSDLELKINLLKSLQASREAFREFSLPIVFWFPESMLDSLIILAPDFWSWRKGVFYFNQELKIPSSIPSNLPYRGSRKCVGRENLLLTLHEALQRDRSRGVAITGMAGIGKTELALQYAKKYENEYTGGMVWITLAATTLSEAIVAFTQPYLQIPTTLSLEQKVQFCWTNWKPSQGNVLVILDDVRSSDNIPAMAMPIDPRFQFLITTRQRKLTADLLSLDLDILSESESLAFLEEQISKDRVQKEIAIARDICQSLGYLPLALELTARYLAIRKNLSLAEYEQQFNQQHLQSRSLTGAMEMGITAERGVFSAFELSWRNLSEDARNLGCRLSLFAPGSIDWTWIEALDTRWDAEYLKDLRVELENLSLLQSDSNRENLCHLHPLLREFFQEKLQDIGRADKYKRDFCRLMLEIARKSPSITTLKEIEFISPIIPSLKEIAKELTNWLADGDVILPSTVLGRFYEGQIAYSEAEFWYQQSIETAKQRFGENHPNVVTSYNNLAGLYQATGRYGEAEPLYQKALKIRLEQLGENHQDVAASYNNLAGLYRVTGRYGEAEPLYQKALKISLEQLGKNHQDVATSYNNLALLYQSTGRYEKAEPLFQKALEICLEQLGENHPYVATYYNNLALLYESTGRYGEAEPLYQKALDIYLEQLGENHPYVATSYNNLAGLYESTGRYGEAEPLYQKALKIRLEQLGENHPAVATSYNNLAELYRVTGRYGEAIAYYQKALEISLEQLGENYPAVAFFYNNLASLYESTGRYGEAIAYYQKAINIALKTLGKNHPSTVKFANNYLTMLREVPLEELLAIVPADLRKLLLQMEKLLGCDRRTLWIILSQVAREDNLPNLNTETLLGLLDRIENDPAFRQRIIDKISA
jgi:tetratricopeptide (TPR) repeat protein